MQAKKVQGCFLEKKVDFLPKSSKNQILTTQFFLIFFFFKDNFQRLFYNIYFDYWWFGDHSDHFSECSIFAHLMDKSCVLLLPWQQQHVTALWATLDPSYGCQTTPPGMWFGSMSPITIYLKVSFWRFWLGLVTFNSIVRSPNRYFAAFGHGWRGRAISSALIASLKQMALYSMYSV